MDYVSDIAAMSMSLNAARLQMDVSLSVAKNAMDVQEEAAAELLEMLPSPPGLGQYVDVMA